MSTCAAASSQRQPARRPRRRASRPSLEQSAEQTAFSIISIPAAQNAQQNNKYKDPDPVSVRIAITTVITLLLLVFVVQKNHLHPWYYHDMKVIRFSC